MSITIPFTSLYDKDQNGHALLILGCQVGKVAFALGFSHKNKSFRLLPIARDESLYFRGTTLIGAYAPTLRHLTMPSHDNGGKPVQAYLRKLSAGRSGVSSVLLLLPFRTRQRLSERSVAIRFLHHCV
jgi:hypothetical protein